MSAAKAFLQIRPLPVRSLLLAPLASIPVLTLRGLGTSDAGVVSDVGVGLLFSMLLLPFSYAGMLLVGLPMFILLRRFKRLLLLASCGLGATLLIVRYKKRILLRSSLLSCFCKAANLI